MILTIRKTLQLQVGESNLQLSSDSIYFAGWLTANAVYYVRRGDPVARYGSVMYCLLSTEKPYVRWKEHATS